MTVFLYIVVAVILFFVFNIAGRFFLLRYISGNYYYTEDLDHFEKWVIMFFSLLMAAAWYTSVPLIVFIAILLLISKLIFGVTNQAVEWIEGRLFNG